MPEGHTIHRIARDHTKALAGQALAVESPQGRFADGAALLDGSVLEGVEAWGKHLFYRFAGERLLHVHLGLYGKFWPFTPPAPPTHRQVRLRLTGATRGFELTGPIACEVLDPPARAAIVSRLGPDPIRTDADGGLVVPKLARRHTSIGAALLDQSVVAGVGNVYRAEALYVHGMHPARPASTVGPDEWQPIWQTLVRMLRAGVRTRSIVTVDRHDETVTDGRSRYVYKQERCARHPEVEIRRWDLAGRWAYACEACQPPWPA
ncbi:MAG TPA: DNA-formamidopyrimidine glycosylase family protein [Acidimicrobiales bacterium]|nr:DNA-formamidopyrimidine glycosylase family protein [Acidimicrobiales bacterium]